MSHFTTIVIIGIVSILLLLILAGLLIGPGPAPTGPGEPEPPAGEPADQAPGADRRAGGPGFRSQALALAQRRVTDTPRRRRRRQARSLNAAQSAVISELAETPPEGGTSASRE